MKTIEQHRKNLIKIAKKNIGKYDKTIKELFLKSYLENNESMINICYEMIKFELDINTKKTIMNIEKEIKKKREE